jgi:hypothetical protein
MATPTTTKGKIMALFIFICHTDGCENEGIEIPFPDPAPSVICGACDQEVTDKTPAEEA